ncbi:sigma-54-dependent transcriptional regulator [Nitratidesulfovibrio sp. D1]|uniref:sigma-54-dependent transcriptional regulator n=1 Tax=Nitratidesulfovibrio sp. D1 TaxID=3440151 RepID=UPI003EBFCBB6
MNDAPGRTTGAVPPVPQPHSPQSPDTPGPARILVVDDEAIARDNLALVLGRQGHETLTAASGVEALQLLAGADFDLVLTDLMMQGMDGLDLLRAVRLRHPDTEVVVVTGYPTVKTAVEAMHAGAYHYLSKPYDLDEARALVQKALEKRRLKQEVARLREQLRERSLPVPLLGAAPCMQALKRTIAQVAPSDVTVLILGETGTGKELAARMVHLFSRRSEARFLAINCGAFNEELLESELFGHEQGAFSGAVRQRKGLFEAAEGGTLFLDEVGEMSLPMQVKLLRAVQERTIRRVGGTADIPVDVRLVAATNKDLAAEAAAGRFRHDLYYRLNVVVLRMPPLAERMEDVPLLAQYFAEKAARDTGRPAPHMAQETLAVLARYPFPGNVRELQNIVERAAVLRAGDTITPADLPPDLRALADGLAGKGSPPLVLRADGAGEGMTPDGRPMTLDENERAHIEWVLELAGGNRTQAAKVLDIDRASLWRKLKRYGL